MSVRGDINAIYVTLKALRKRIDDLETHVRVLRTNAIGQQMQACEEMHGFGAPVLPYNEDAYCLPPKIKDDSIFKSEEEVFGPLKKKGRAK